MKKGRLEAFSDGVLAIIITIMVLEMKVPHGVTWESLRPVVPVLLSYILSFIYLGIYWNNHHHMLSTVKKANGVILWANLHLLFWLSLVPFVTGWMGENNFAKTPVLLYGVVLLMAGIAYWLLQTAIIHSQGSNSLLLRAVGSDIKGKSSPVIYVVGILLGLVNPWIAIAVFGLVAVMWLVPDQRIERIYNECYDSEDEP